MKLRNRILSRLLILIMMLSIALGNNAFTITASAKGHHRSHNIGYNVTHNKGYSPAHNKGHHGSHGKGHHDDHDKRWFVIRFDPCHKPCHKPNVTETDAPIESIYTYNPHACSQKLYDAYGSKYWDTLFNLIDALRAGEDTFECPDEDAFEWCGQIPVLNHYIPLAKLYIQLEEGNYSDGVGKITYTIPKEEYVQKEQEFEDSIMGIINEYVRKDDSDFEKCMALFEYFSLNYEYDSERKEKWFDADDELYNQQGFGSYYAFMNNDHAICEEVTALFDYMLNQCGVDALAFKSDEIRHMWSYATMDGVGFYFDCTGGMCMSVDEAVLGWFGMTDENCHKAYADDISPINLHRDIDPSVVFSGTDDRFDRVHFGTLVEMDRERKVIRIRIDDEIGEYNYETGGDIIFASKAEDLEDLEDTEEPEDKEDLEDIEDTYESDGKKNLEDKEDTYESKDKKNLKDKENACESKDKKNLKDKENACESKDKKNLKDKEDAYESKDKEAVDNTNKLDKADAPEKNEGAENAGELNNVENASGVDNKEDIVNPERLDKAEGQDNIAGFGKASGIDNKEKASVEEKNEKSKKAEGIANPEELGNASGTENVVESEKVAEPENTDEMQSTEGLNNIAVVEDPAA